MTDSNSETEELKKLLALCSEDWKIDEKKKEISISKKNGISGVVEKIWRRKHKTEVLYRWLQYELYQNEMHLANIIERDQIPKRENYPRVYTLLDDWTIPKKDRSSLTHGPLFDSNGVELVKPGGIVSYYWNRFWPVFVVIATIVGFVSAIRSLFQ